MRTSKLVNSSILSIGFLLNLIILYFFIQKSRRNPFSTHYFFIINIALSDAITCLSRVWFMISVMLSPQHTPLFCRIGEMPFMTADVSLWILLAISCDRYRKIIKPLHRQMDKRAAVLICVVSYTIAFGLHSRFALTDSFIPNPYGACFTKDNIGMRISLILLLILSITLPIALILTLNYRASKQLSASQNVTSDNRNNVLEYRRNLAASKTLNALTVLAIATALFPRLLVAVIYVLQAKGFLKDSWSLNLLETSYDVFFLNNALNFFVYLKFMTNFRHFVLRKWFCAKRDVKRNHSISMSEL